MEREFGRLKIKPDLSTVLERDFDDLSETLTKDNIHKLNRRVESNKKALLQQYVDSESGDETSWSISSTDNFSLNKNKILNPVIDENNNVVSTKECNPRNISNSSLSSKARSSIQSLYSESDTEKSDYGLEYEDVDHNLDLMGMFKKKQMQVKNETLARHAMNRVEKHSVNSRSSSHRYHDHEYVDNYSKDPDFDNIDEIDFMKLQRFNNSPIKLSTKKSMPLINVKTSITGSPRKLKRFQSSLEISTSRNLKYPVFTGHELDEIDDSPKTPNRKKEERHKRKVKIDLNQYAEPVSQVKTMMNNRSLSNTLQKDSKTSQLTREGKLRLIRSLGKPKVKKVMNGHLYGELIYDPGLLKWKGNEEELDRFESLNKAMPKLINNKKNEIPGIFGDMVYDNTKLKWVNVKGQYDDDPFGEDFDMTFREPVKRIEGRGVSGRLVPSESTLSLSKNSDRPNNYFKVTPNQYRDWKNEEERWVRKVGNWFPNDSDAHGFKYDLKGFLNRQ